MRTGREQRGEHQINRSTPMQRIMIIGGSGSGKSTLARALGGRLDLPVHHMDHFFWMPGWEERPKDECLHVIRCAVSGDRWVIEGSHASSYPVRLARADTLIALDLPFPLCLLRASRRCFRYRGQRRPDLHEGCVESLWRLPSFLHFIISTHRERQDGMRALYRDAEIAKHLLKRPGEVAAFLASV